MPDPRVWRPERDGVEIDHERARAIRAGKQRPLDKCPQCGGRFSDWFTWHGWRHCYPCWSFCEGYNYTYLETGERIQT